MSEDTTLATMVASQERRYVDAHVWLSPGRYSGEPCIGGHRLPTRLVADLVYGDQAWDLESGYDLTREEVIVACWYEARHGRSKKLRREWRSWLDAHEGALWHLDPAEWAKLPLPPVALRPTQEEVR